MTCSAVSPWDVDEPALPMVCTPWEVQLRLHPMLNLGQTSTTRSQSRNTPPPERCTTATRGAGCRNLGAPVWAHRGDPTRPMLSAGRTPVRILVEVPWTATTPG